MNLTLETSLHGISRALTERIVPALTDPFAAEAARLAKILLTISANAVDDAAAIRVAENARLRALFGAAAGAVEPALAADLAAAAASQDPGLRISELDAENGRLRALLVRLHAAAEGQALERQIWAMLADFEAARAPRTE